MLTSVLSRQVFIFWILGCSAGITAVARADSYSSNRKSKVVGYRPALTNNRTQFNQLGFKANVTNPQTRPSWQQSQASHPAAYPSYAPQANYNLTRPSWQQPAASNYPALHPTYGQPAALNQAIPSLSNYSQHSFNQNRSLAHNHAQYSLKGQYSTLNQPSAPPLPNYSAQSRGSISWTASTNQTNLYPSLNDSKLPLTPQGPATGAQAMLSYGTGHFYSLPARGFNKTASIHNANSNPYANSRQYPTNV